MKKKIWCTLVCTALLAGTFSCTSSTPSAPSAPASSEGAIAVDLTDMSANMVYAQVYNMVNAPEEYRRKSVKMRGLFGIRQDEKTGAWHYGCIIQDALACCAQGIEFIPEKEMTFPDDFPEPGEEITVSGVFDFTTDGQTINCILRQAVMEE
ncbi:MAG: hypothetical protein IKS37_03755 [Solobacterium sp.]|nr:hypothetical protein [Solobacterium sp.]